MKALSRLFIFTCLFVISSCSDPCDSIYCGPDGFCIEGDCLCPDGWTGPNCSEPDPCLYTFCFFGDCINGACQCEEGWTGEYCSDQIPPTDMIIKSIKLLRWPDTDDNGNFWDAVDSGPNPDITIKVEYSDGPWELFSSEDSPYPNVSQGAQPEWLNLNIDVNYPEEDLEVTIWNADVTDPSNAAEFMAGLIGPAYIPAYVLTQGGFNETLVWDEEEMTIAFEFEVEYQWN